MRKITYFRDFPYFPRNMSRKVIKNKNIKKGTNCSGKQHILTPDVTTNSIKHKIKRLFNSFIVAVEMFPALTSLSEITP